MRVHWHRNDVEHLRLDVFLTRQDADMKQDAAETEIRIDSSYLGAVKLHVLHQNRKEK